MPITREKKCQIQVPLGFIQLCIVDQEDHKDTNESLDCIFLHKLSEASSQEELWTHITRAHNPRELMRLHIKFD